jgi:hypothetical protein
MATHSNDLNGSSTTTRIIVGVLLLVLAANVTAIVATINKANANCTDIRELKTRIEYSEELRKELRDELRLVNLRLSHIESALQIKEIAP